MVPNNDAYTIPYKAEVIGDIDIDIGEGWIPLNHILRDGIQKTEIHCSWADADSADRVGIWIGVSDERVAAPVSNWTNGYAIESSKYLNQSPLVDVANWHFGQTAKLVIQTIQAGQELSMYILCRPRFKGDKKRRLNIEVKEFERHNSTTSNEPLRLSFDFCKDDAKPVLKTTIDALDKMGSYNHEGSGNVIHPKQVLTLKALDHVFRKEGLSNRTSVSIAYIGTDTMENLTSIVRWLNSQQLYQQQISHITAFTTDEWDDEITTLLDDVNQSNIGRDSKVKLVPNNEAQRIEAEPHDIVITTYVCPWVEESKKNEFKELIGNLMDEQSILISVDPKVARSSVRSPIFNSSEFNPQSIYIGRGNQELGFLNMKFFRFESSEAVLYRRPIRKTRVES
jgi:hypothetical protein